MPTPGPLVFQKIQSAVENARQQETGLRAKWRKLDERIANLLAQRGEAILVLAKHYLPDLTQESISGTLLEIRDELRAVFEQKENRVQQLEEQFGLASAQREQENTKLRTVTQQLNQKVRQREELEKRVAAALAENKEFQTLSKQALASEQELQRNEERVAEITRESKGKLPAYNKSRLFRYLYDRKFGTPDYHHRGLTRRIDRWVSQLIDYYHARKGYEFLTQTPVLMQEEYDHRREEFHHLMSQVEELEHFAADEAGLLQVLAEGDELGTQRDALVSTVDGRKTRCQNLQHELAQLQQSQGPYYDRALDRFRRFLSQTESAALEQHAKLTQETADDEFVREIVQLSQEIDELSPNLKSLAQECEDVEKQHAGLDTFVRRYQQANFDSERSYFPDDFDVHLFLDRFLAGTMSRDEVWQRIRRFQEFEPTWAEQSVNKAGDALNSPLGHVLLHALVEVAGAAMSNSAQRSVQRRSSGNRGSSSYQQRGQSHSPVTTPSRPARRNRGFTSGNGF